MTWYNILILCSVPTIFSIIWQALATHIQNKKSSKDKKRQALDAGVQALLRERILQNHRYFVNRGYITAIEKQVFMALAESYEALGENGFMTSVINEVLNLPVKN